MTPPSSNHPGAANIRSGMSVQDLKMLTAQREYRAMMVGQYSSSVDSPPHATTVSSSSPRSNRSLSLALSDTSSTVSTSSPMGSPLLSPQRPSAPLPPPMHLPHHLMAAKFNHPPSYSRHAAHYEQRVLVTCGGQVVSLMEGVRNVPIECCYTDF
ncbi:Aste57867_14941 [Aphanomyces stellatus]|uniref:Aste57867_14941 protein n=1 Tax=Aphanomyces stellatus TaxID=120398 RepID=A0A485L4L9_9STRA|nr:hypothetical protein As57867_014885 [Aphanomyces stellatus]VFT91755.1 Aste57867_14941 [Aphanomyces stellatus]